MTPSPRARPQRTDGPRSLSRWWDGAVGYEVYIRSFADGDGDGVGDLPGVLSRLDHLADLGVDLVWVTPFYPSPMHDHGYDVADYTGVEPVFGTLADIDALIEAVHTRGMRLVIDLVPNHTSSEHPWFRAARSSREDPHRDWYVWRDPAPDGGPPNNWVSHFGGGAWTLDRATGQYWLHLFLPEQPDLNWANPAVADAFDGVLEFWLGRGVDGFRIDVAHALVKHPELPDNPPSPAVAPEDRPDGVEMGSTTSSWESMEHRYDVDQPAVLEVYRRWRAIADRHGALLLGEVYVLQPERLLPYLAEDDGLHLAFWFAPLHRAWGAAHLRAVLAEGVEVARRARAGVAWVQGSHDRSRAATRYGGGTEGRRRSLAVATLEAFLPGVPFVYQGEELGLDDAVLRPEDAQDPIAAREGEHARSRDVARTPLPWTTGPGMGFTTAASTWLPMGQRVDADTAEVQATDPASPLSTYRRLLAERREWLADGAGPDEPVVWLEADPDMVAYRRGELVVAANLGDAASRAPQQAKGLTVTFSTLPCRTGTAALQPAEARVYRRPQASRSL